jgi:hypothetical protein
MMRRTTANVKYDSESNISIYNYTNNNSIQFFIIIKTMMIIIIIIIQFLYLSACQQRVAYNRRAQKVYMTKPRLRLELELELEQN